MNQYEQESLSALMDGETDELELRRVLKAMESDSELAQRWQRYHLAQSVLHDRGIPVADTLAEKVAAAVEQEPAVVRAGSHRWTAQLTRVAIAASVAVVAVIALQPQVTSPEAPAVVQQSAPVAQEQLLQPAALIAETPAIEVDPVATQRLRDYIEGMRFDPEEPVRIEHLQDSPLYRLVNEYQTRP